jgi:4-hydroxybenzoate polyprenyltransferase
MYRIRLPRAFGRKVGIQSLEQMRGSKEFFVGLAWASLAGLVPGLAAHRAPELWPGALVAFSVIFLLAFQRTLVLDYQAVRADQIVGRETLASLLNKRRARQLFGLATVCAIGILMMGIGAGWVSRFAWPFSAAVALAGVVFLRAARRRDVTDEWSEARVDWVFYVAGLCAFVAMATG